MEDGREGEAGRQAGRQTDRQTDRERSGTANVLQ